MKQHPSRLSLPKWVPPVTILLLAAILRWQGLAAMESMLMHDEAYNLWDALGLIDSPRLTPFLDSNAGRESGWHYFLIPFVWLLGARPLAAHFAASVAGILTVAAVYRLGKTLFDRQTAIWCAFALATLYAHVHLSHLGLRAMLYPLVGTLAIIALLRARQSHSHRTWLVGGVWLGLLMYTYFSARVWIIYVWLWLLYVWLREARQRRGVLLAALSSLLVALPQFVYMGRFPVESFGRISGVSALSPAVILNNVRAWLGALFFLGDANATTNLAQRPLLDVVMAVLFLAGLVTAVRRLTGKLVWWVFGLGAVSLLPSVLSNFAPHYLRGVGLVVPLALLIGIGMRGLQQHFSAWQPRLARYGPFIGVIAFLAVAATTYSDFREWLVADGIEASMEMYVNGAARWLEEELPDDDRPVYFSPFSPYHPNVAILRNRLWPRHVGAFVAGECLVISDESALLINVPAFQPELENQLAQWAGLTEIYRSGREFREAPLFEVYEMRPASKETLSVSANSPVFSGIQVRFAPLPAEVAAGDTVTITLAVRAQAPQKKAYSAFVHLHGEPTPYEGGTLWANSSQWLCPSYPAPEWRPDEVIVQTIPLQLPAETPAGSYEVAIGLFESPAGPRLPLTAPATEANQFFVIGSTIIN